MTTDSPQGAEVYPGAPLDTLVNLAEALVHLTPELQGVIGDIALHGATAEGQEWLNVLADNIDVIDAVTKAITQAADTIPGYFPPEVPDEPELVEEPGNTPNFAEQLQQLPLNTDLSPNEQSGIRQAIAFLSQADERQTLRTILTAVFGQSHLPRTEEARFAQILDDYAARGVLEGYGKSYGFKSLTAQDEQMAAEESAPSIEAVQEVSDYQLVEVVRSKLEGEATHIGKIIRTIFKGQILPRNEHLAFIERLNKLAEAGYLSHTDHSPWYGIGESSIPEPEQPAPSKPKIRPQFPSITTPVLHGEQPQIVEPIQPAPTLQPANRGSDAPKPKVQAEAVQTGVALPGLTDRESLITEAILASITPGEWFAQKQVNLDAISFSSEGARRQAYIKLTDKLIGLGILQPNDKQRGGRKYMVMPEALEKFSITPSSQPAAAPKAPAIDQPPRHRESSAPYYDRVATEAQRQTRLAGQEQPILPTPRELREAARFTEQLISYISDIEEETTGTGVKWTYIAKRLAPGLGLEIGDAQELVRSLQRQGLLFETGHHKGTRKLTTRIIDANDVAIDVPMTADQLSQKAREVQRIQDLREAYGVEIVKFLSNLAKGQTEFKTAISVALNGAINVEDVNPVCQLLRNEGLLTPKAQQGRGSRRGRKGTTWALTGRGRRMANEALRNGGLTNAEKRVLSKTQR